MRAPRGIKAGYEAQPQAGSGCSQGAASRAPSHCQRRGGASGSAGQRARRASLKASLKARFTGKCRASLGWLRVGGPGSRAGSAALAPSRRSPRALVAGARFNARRSHYHDKAAIAGGPCLHRR